MRDGSVVRVRGCAPRHANARARAHTHTLHAFSLRTHTTDLSLPRARAVKVIVGNKAKKLEECARSFCVRGSTVLQQKSSGLNQHDVSAIFLVSETNKK
jgi:hypothetical protein